MSSNPILIDAKPSAANTTVLFSTAPGQTASGTVFCMNQGTDIDRVSVALVPNGEILGSNCWIAYQSILHYGHSLYLQQLCIGSEDSVVIESTNGTTSFIFTGTYVDA